MNLYGKTKRDGEFAVLEVIGSKSIVLRVPVLFVVSLYLVRRLTRNTIMHRYGPAPNNADTAVNILIDIVSDQSGKQYKMDHYATRYPTNVQDIANFLVRLSSKLSLPTLRKNTILRSLMIFLP